MPALLTRVAAAIEAVRPVGTSYAVIPPTLLGVAIALAVTTDGTTPHTSAAAAVTDAISAYVSGLPIGASLPFARITQIAFAASSAVTNVSRISLNGATADIVPTAVGVIRPSAIAVS